jgi:hypothetical protein
MAVLRDYVYVDLGKVRGLIGQINQGVDETTTTRSTNERGGHAGLPIGGFNTSTVQEQIAEKSLSDGLFGGLEADLEALGFLRDISRNLLSARDASSVKDLVAPGQMVRITAPGTMFHPSLMADSILGMATLAQGISDLQTPGGEAEPPVIPPTARKQQARNLPKTKPRPQQQTGPLQPEDALADLDTTVLGVEARYLMGMIRAVRGVYRPGLYLSLRPGNSLSINVTARLEEGRHFLDSEVDVLFARYGVFPQDWTIVGTVGQIGTSMEAPVIDDLTQADGTVSRMKMADMISQFVGYMGSLGFIDLPQPPGFSIVPLAVYRTIPRCNSAE